MDYDNNCINCEYGRMISTFPLCVECIANSKKGSQFPNWEAKTEVK